MTYKARFWMTFVSGCKSTDLKRIKRINRINRIKRISRFIFCRIALIDVKRGHVDVADQERGHPEKKILT